MENLWKTCALKMAWKNATWEEVHKHFMTELKSNDEKRIRQAYADDWELGDRMADLEFELSMSDVQELVNYALRGEKEELFKWLINNPIMFPGAGSEADLAKELEFKNYIISTTEHAGVPHFKELLEPLREYVPKPFEPLFD